MISELRLELKKFFFLLRLPTLLFVDIGMELIEPPTSYLDVPLSTLLSLSRSFTADLIYAVCYLIPLQFPFSGLLKLRFHDINEEFIFLNERQRYILGPQFALTHVLQYKFNKIAQGQLPVNRK